MLNQANARQIKAGAIDNTHLSATAAIDETKLNIDWAARTTEILASRTVVDFVQLNGVSVGNEVKTVTLTGVTAPAAATADARGIVVQAPANRVILRDASTGEPLVGSTGKEVYARITKPAQDFILSFYTKNADGTEVDHTTTSGVTIDLQYPQRFDLSTVSETFASNEKFVDGGANVSERLDIAQIAKDVFGGTYTLDKDGQANNAKSIVTQLSETVTALQNADTTLDGKIDSEITARVSAVSGVDGRTTQLETEVHNARGASLNLKAELTRIEGLAGGASTSNQEVIDARNGKATLNDELTAIRQSVSTEVTNRTNDDKTINDNATALAGRVTTVEGKVHGHFAEDKQVLTGDPLISTSAYTLQSANKFVAGNKSLQVFINGFLQMVGVHYTEVEAGGAGTGGTGVNFAPTLIEQNDIIQLRWSK